MITNLSLFDFDIGSNLSQSCYDYFDSSVRQKDNLLSIPVKVLYVRTSLPGGAIDIHIDILNALKRPLNRGQLRDLRRRVKGTLKSYQVQLLIIDDAHLLKRKAMVELVKIYEDLKIPVVMSGAKDLFVLLVMAIALIIVWSGSLNLVWDAIAIG